VFGNTPRAADYAEGVAGWVPVIAHRDFYDVPHLLVVRVGRRLLLLESRFDEALDDYEAEYSVYELVLSNELPSGSWDHLSDGLTPVAMVAVRDVEFGHDSEGRYALRSIPLEALGR
jgi:hypothetical protein